MNSPKPLKLKNGKGEDLLKKAYGLTVDEVRDLLDYNPVTGEFVWKITLSNRAPAGSVAGNVTEIGYRHIKLNGRTIRACRLAWFHYYGEIGGMEIDHINGDRADDRIANLRLCTRSQNLANRRKQSNNSSGYKGVSKSLGKWRATIRAGGRNIHLGTFECPRLAHQAYLEAARKYYGEFHHA